MSLLTYEYLKQFRKKELRKIIQDKDREIKILTKGVSELKAHIEILQEAIKVRNEDLREVLDAKQ